MRGEFLLLANTKVYRRSWDVDGVRVASGEAESSFEKSDFGCRGPAHFLVNPCHVGSLGS